MKKDRTSELPHFQTFIYEKMKKPKYIIIKKDLLHSINNCYKT